MKGKISIIKSLQVKVKALRQLALGEVSACGRNWYLTEARVVEGLSLKPAPFMVKKRIYTGTLYDLFLLLTVMVDYEKAQDVRQTACFHFTDCCKVFVLKVLQISVTATKRNWWSL